MKQLKLSIIVPVYNEARTVGELLQQVYNVELGKNIAKEVIIIESNSSDNSRNIILNFKDRPDTVIILEDKPKGKGRAVRKGLKKATGDIIIIQDADLEYSAQDYSKLITPIINNEVDFVLGSRNFKTKEWKIRRMKDHKFYASMLNIGGYVVNWLFNFIYGTDFSDQATMFKVFRRDLLNCFTLESDYFALDIELLAKISLTRCRRKEVHVSYKARTIAEGKKTRVFRELFSLTHALLKYRFAHVKRYRSVPL